MSMFLDAITGRTWHWNSTRLEVHRLVYPRLSLFDAVQYGPRDILFAQYSAFFDHFGGLLFSQHPETGAREFVGRAKSLNRIGLTKLISSYCCDFVVRSFAGNKPRETWETGAALALFCTKIYDRSAEFEQVSMHAFVNSDSDLSARLLASEIASVMGLDFRSDEAIMPWLALRKFMDFQIVKCLNDAAWNQAVTRELSRPPRLGGYSDSILK